MTISANPLMEALNRTWNEAVQNCVAKGLIQPSLSQQIVAMFPQYSQYMSQSVHSQYGNRIPASAIKQIVEAVFNQIIASLQQQSTVQQFGVQQQQPIIQDYGNGGNLSQGIPTESPPDLEDFNRVFDAPVEQERSVPEQPTPDPQPQVNSVEIDISKEIEIDPKFHGLTTNYIARYGGTFKYVPKKTEDNDLLDRIESVPYHYVVDLVGMGSVSDGSNSAGEINRFFVEEIVSCSSFVDTISSLNNVRKLAKLEKTSTLTAKSTVHLVNDSYEDENIIRGAKNMFNSIENVQEKLVRIADSLSSISNQKLRKFLTYVFNDNLKRYIRVERFIENIVRINEIREIGEFFDQSMGDFMSFPTYEKHLNTCLMNTLKSIGTSDTIENGKLIAAAVTDINVMNSVDHDDLRKIIGLLSISIDMAKEVYDEHINVSVLTMNRNFVLIDINLPELSNPISMNFKVNNDSVLSTIIVGENRAVFKDVTGVWLSSDLPVIVKNGVTLDGNPFFLVDSYL